MHCSGYNLHLVIGLSFLVGVISSLLKSIGPHGVDVWNFVCQIELVQGISIWNSQAEEGKDPQPGVV